MLVQTNRRESTVGATPVHGLVVCALNVNVHLVAAFHVVAADIQAVAAVRMPKEHSRVHIFVALVAPSL